MYKLRCASHRLLIVILCLLLPVNLQASAVVPASGEQLKLSFAPIVKRTVPAVVNIYTRHVEKVQVSPLFNDPLFREFFGQGLGGLPRERVVNSLGSGVVISADGMIVTNHHVVSGSDEITVVLSDRREFVARIEKMDERSDLAVLKVDTKGASLPFLSMRDSDTLEVGDIVLAVGNPFGVGQTVTSGIISALARSASDISDYQFFIQTDAAINPGNSGGALVDSQGKLIGINTAIYSRSGGSQGIGFAIPANMVRAVVKGQVGDAGKVIRPWFGISVQPVTREIADAQGLPAPQGVLVQQVAKDSPADKAGIKPGDILTRIGNGEVNDPQSMNFRIATTGIGQPTTVTLLRGVQTLTLEVMFVPVPERQLFKAITLKGNHPLSSATVAELTPELKEELKLPDNVKGVVVVRGNDGGYGTGVEKGDIILNVNDQDVETVDGLQKLLNKRSRGFKIVLVRGGMVLTLATLG